MIEPTIDEQKMRYLKKRYVLHSDIVNYIDFFNDYDVVRTDISTVQKHLWNIILKNYEITKQVGNIASIKDSVQKTVDEINADINRQAEKYGLGTGLEKKIEESSSRFNRINDRIQKINQTIEIVKENIGINQRNLLALYSMVGDSASTFVTIINHDDPNIGSENSAKAHRNKLLSNNLALEENIQWFNFVEQKYTRQQMLDAMESQIARVPEYGLYIFIYAGHGGGGNERQYLALPGVSIFDYQIWDKFIKCKGRIFAIFDCCHAGTMYQAESPDTISNLSDDATSDVEEEETDLPFGISWMKEMTTSSDDTEGADSLSPRKLVEGYSPLLGSNYNSLFPKNDPVYVRLRTNAVRMIALSASPQQTYGWARKGGHIFSTKLLEYYGQNKSYGQIFNQAYNAYRNMNFSQDQKKYSGYSLCTFTSDDFNPNDYAMYTNKKIS